MIKKVIALWVVLPFLSFLIFGNWFLDYLAPVFSVFIGVSYLFLALINHKKKRFRLDLFSAMLSLILGASMLIIVHLATPELTKNISNKIASIKLHACGPNKMKKGLWETIYITEGFLTA